MTNTNRKTLAALIITFALIIAGMFAVAYVSYANGQASVTPAASADITVMPCSAWDNGANPVIPEFTLTDTCVDPSGTLHTAPTSISATR